MTEAEWVRFLTVNTIFLVFLLAIVGVWLWLLRGSAWSSGIQKAVLVAIVGGAVLGIVQWLRQSPSSVAVPDFVWPWGAVVAMGVYVTSFALLVLFVSSILLGYRRLRSTTSPG